MGRKKRVKIRPEYELGENVKSSQIECRNCRHANHNTDDYAEGFVACRILGGLRLNKSCDVTLPVKKGEYYMYESFDGQNCTWNLGDVDFEITYLD